MRARAHTRYNKLETGFGLQECLLLSSIDCSDVCWSLRGPAWLSTGITYDTLRTTGYWLLSKQYWFNSLGCNLGSQSFKSSPGDPNLQLKTRTNDFYLLGSKQLDPFANGVKAELFKQLCSLDWLEVLHKWLMWCSTTGDCDFIGLRCGPDLKKQKLGDSKMPSCRAIVA